MTPFEDGPVTCATFDHSGKYLVRPLSPPGSAARHPYRPQQAQPDKRTSRVQACGGPALKVYELVSKGKKKAANALKSVLDLPKKGVHALAFGPHAHSLYVGAADHNLRKFVC